MLGLSAKDKKDIALIVVSELNKAPKKEAVEQEDTIEEAPIKYQDPLAKVCDEKLASIIQTLPTGNVIVRGRTGTTMINQSEESRNTIMDTLKDRKNFYTRNKLR